MKVPGILHIRTGATSTTAFCALQVPAGVPMLGSLEHGLERADARVQPTCSRCLELARDARNAEWREMRRVLQTIADIRHGGPVAQIATAKRSAAECLAKLRT